MKIIEKLSQFKYIITIAALCALLQTIGFQNELGAIGFSIGLIYSLIQNIRAGENHKGGVILGIAAAMMAIQAFINSDGHDIGEYLVGLGAISGVVGDVVMSFKKRVSNSENIIIKAIMTTFRNPGTYYAMCTLFFGLAALIHADVLNFWGSTSSLFLILSLASCFYSIYLATKRTLASANGHITACKINDGQSNFWLGLGSLIIAPTFFISAATLNPFLSLVGIAQIGIFLNNILIAKALNPQFTLR